MSVRVLVTDYAWPSLDIERGILSEIDAELIVAETGLEDELISVAPDVDAILTCWKPVTAGVLQAAGKCRTVARYGVGLDNIDIRAATELGILVSNVPDFCSDEVADHTLALILSQARHIPAYDRQVSRGGWDNKEFGSMHRLRGRVLGLVGYGSIAQGVATRALAFGMDVVAFSPSRVGTPADGSVRFADSLDSLLREADIVSLHLPATPATDKFIGAKELAAFKPGACLVNTSRGALIDEDALVAALNNHQLHGAALDVLVSEPPLPTHPLRQLPNTILTPHAAFMSEESVTELQQKAARNVTTVLRGEIPETTVNGEVLQSASLRVPLRTARG
ncbi:C-terminal binding protein [Rhodococcus opacus]|uniref:C-terminal binding protein n=1 Tax=Rhodococcus opacus TaxID=37919 RepID=UPI00294A7310|nr:C-terminal binding protein [Rhodococcus opacus]MDV6247446.1 C-terminal binding protein [Rhodococcus opacus]